MRRSENGNMQISMRCSGHGDILAIATCENRPRTTRTRLSLRNSTRANLGMLSALETGKGFGVPGVERRVYLHLDTLESGPSMRPRKETYPQSTPPDLGAGTVGRGLI